MSKASIRPRVTSTEDRPLAEQPTADFLGGGLFLFGASELTIQARGAAAFGLKAARFDFSPAGCEPDKSFPGKIPQQLQVRSLPDGFIVGRPFTLSQSKCNLLEFLGSRFYRLT